MSSVFRADLLPDLLPLYYRYLFPYEHFYTWLSYGNVERTYFCNREFSFTLKDDIYLRYQSFSNQLELEKEIQKKCPYKIDIGAVYTHKPKDHKTVRNFEAIEKELVFDIDMTDYDDVRFCCSEADICLKCWPLMTFAIKVLNRALRDDFGFEHLLWVYSGRRGVHCWVADTRARKLTQATRIAIAEYLTVVKGGANQIKKVNLGERSLHPSIKAALEILTNLTDDKKKDEFLKYVKRQDLFGTDEKKQKVLALIPEEDPRKHLDKDMAQIAHTSTDAWHVLKDRIPEIRAALPVKNHMVYIVEEIVLQFTYPRLDVNVTKGINHLLKSPFCVHPKTGRVSVPIDLTKVDDFNPFTVPTISQLCDEINKVDMEKSSNKGKLYLHTSLKDYIQVFDDFLKALTVSLKKEAVIKQTRPSEAKEVIATF